MNIAFQNKLLQDCVHIIHKIEENKLESLKYAS